jgi:ribose transport system permease protein
LRPNGFGSDPGGEGTGLNIAGGFSGDAAGQTLVFISGSEGIDLSAGSIVTLTAIVTYVTVNGE